MERGQWGVWGVDGEVVDALENKGASGDRAALSGKGGVEVRDEPNMWALPVRERWREYGVTVRVLPAGPWAVCGARLEWFPWALFYFYFIYSFSFSIFLICFYFFFILIQNYIKPACTIL
jgi:hypothetical protein